MAQHLWSSLQSGDGASKLSFASKHAGVQKPTLVWLVGPCLPVCSNTGSTSIADTGHQLDHTRGTSTEVCIQQSKEVWMQQCTSYKPTTKGGKPLKQATA